MPDINFQQVSNWNSAHSDQWSLFKSGSLQWTSHAQRIGVLSRLGIPLGSVGWPTYLEQIFMLPRGYVLIHFGDSWTFYESSTLVWGSCKVPGWFHLGKCLKKNQQALAKDSWQVIRQTISQSNQQYINHYSLPAELRTDSTRASCTANRSHVGKTNEVSPTSSRGANAQL